MASRCLKLNSFCEKQRFVVTLTKNASLLGHAPGLKGPVEVVLENSPSKKFEFPYYALDGVVIIFSISYKSYKNFVWYMGIISLKFPDYYACTKGHVSGLEPYIPKSSAAVKKVGKKRPLCSDPPNLEVITHNVPRKFHGLTVLDGSFWL